MPGAYGYFLGLGSNIEPLHHFSIAISRLQAEFGRLIVWPVVETDPVAIDSEKRFCNTLLVLRTDWHAEQLKAWTNALEIECGRDRTDPLSGQKDRPLDIDILAQQSQLDLSIVNQFSEPYIQTVLCAATLPVLPGQPRRCEITVAGHRLGHRPAAIDTDHARGHVVVVEDSVDSLFQSFEAPLHSEECLS